MKYKYTYRNGALYAFLDIITMGIFLLILMKRLQKEIEEITNKKFIPYWKMYLLGIITLFIPCVIWISKVAENLNKKAKELKIEGKLTSFNNMFYWNIPGLITIFGPLYCTYIFFDTLNKIEIKLNEE